MMHPSNSQYFGAGAMAVLVHALLIAGLVFSVSWRSLPEPSVYADLWRELPSAPIRPRPPEPITEATTEPPPTPAIRPQPVEEAKPDIALRKLEEERKRQQELKREQLRREAEARAKAAEKARQEQEERQRQQELARKQAEEQRRRAEEARRLAQEQARREMEADMARQMQDELSSESSQLNRKAVQAQAIAQARMVRDYQDRIRSKIRGYLRLPVKLTGNPEVVFQVRLLPGGEILKLNMLKSSGQPAYDEEVERAILKSSPLPLPPDREAAASFREGLILKFRPFEDGEATS